MQTLLWYILVFHPFLYLPVHVFRAWFTFIKACYCFENPTIVEVTHPPLLRLKIFWRVLWCFIVFVCFPSVILQNRLNKWVFYDFEFEGNQPLHDELRQRNNYNCFHFKTAWPIIKRSLRYFLSHVKQCTKVKYLIFPILLPFSGLCAAGLPPARGSMADGVSDKAFLISTRGFKH